MNNNSQNNQGNGMYTNWNNTNRNNQYNPNDKPYLIMSDKEIKNKKRTSAALRLTVYGIFIIIGAMVYYMYQIDKYEFYPKKEEILIANDSKYQIELTPKNAENFDYLNYKYEIEDENIAEVNEYGEIKAKGIGETNLKIKYKYGFNYKTVKIKTENIEVEKIEIKEENDGKLQEGESVEIKTIVNDNEEINKDLNCRSSDEQVVMIDGECKTITPIEEGEATIIIEDPNGEEQEELEIVVESKEVEVERVEVVETKIIIKKGTRGKIEAEVVPENATRKGLKYTSDNGNVTVDGEGNVTGNNVGTSVITIESENGKKGYCTVEVEEESIEIEEIKIKEQEKKLKEGEEYQLKTEIEPSNATERELKWTSNNQGIVSVTNGKIKGIRAGEAEITVETTSGKKATIKITVEAKKIQVKKINIKERTVKIIKGSKYIIGTEIEPSNATNKKLTYKSNNANISVDATGVVYGKTVGKSIVTIESENGKKETVEIEVVELKVEPTGITINAENKEMIVGETGELLISLEPSDVTERGITWTSSNKNVVSVVNGKIVAQGGGEAEITAETTNGLVARCKVIVKVPVTKVTISGEERIKVNKSTQFQVHIEPSNATDKNVKWESINNNIAIVDKNGNVTGKNIGETKIKATVDGKSAEKKIIVGTEKKVVETINLTPTSMDLKEGEEKVFKTVVYPSDAADKSVIWRSSNPEIATVSNGKVKGVNAGETDIVVETKDKRIKTVGKVKVVSKVIEINEIKIKGEKTVKLTKDSKYIIPLEILPNDATNQSVTYKSNNSNVSVDGNGIVIGKKVGKSEVTVTSKNGKTAKITIEVEEKKVLPANVKLDKDTIEIELGKTIDLLATLEPSDVTERTLSWESSNKEIVSVTNGRIKGLKSGSVTITVKTSNGKTAQCKVLVKVPVTMISISGNDKIKVKQNAQYTATIEPKEATDKDIVWTSSDINTATVDKKGNVTGKKAGTTTIRATGSNNIYGEKIIVIEPEIKEVTSVTINPKEVTIKENDKVNLSVDIKPTDASDKTVTWISSDTKVAEVDNKGIVTGIKAGTITITVKTKNGKKATSKIIVKPVEIDANNISLNITDTSIISGESIKLKATIEPSNATNKTVSWESSNTKIATVNSNGKVTANAKTGTVKITAKTNNGKRATCVILVKAKEVKATSISLNNSSLNMNTGDTIKLKATIEPSNVTNKTVTWKSSDENIATVNNKGVVTALKPGTVTITAKTSNGIKAKCKIKIKIAFTWKDGYERDLNPDSGGGAARVYPLPNGTLVGAYEKDVYIYTRVSSNNGKTWSKPVKAASMDGLSCENINFYYYANKLYMAYRAIGKTSSGFYTSLHVNVSNDMGYNWKHHSMIIDNRTSSNSIYRGVWEPYLGEINGKFTVFYANDSYAPSWQNIESKTWNGKEWTDKKVISNGRSHGSRDGMPAWIKLSNGKYALVIEAKESGYEFVIKLLYSDDGVNWSSPKTIYRPTRKGSSIHAAAPGIAELSTGQLVVSFQTNESGDNVVKTIYSDGTSVDKITSDNFSKSEVVFKNTSGMWSGISYKDGWLYMAGGTYMRRLHVG